MTDGPVRPQCVAIVTPAWPPGLAPNGIVTYTSHLVSAFETKGVRSVLLSWHVPGGEEVDSAIGQRTDLIDVGRFGQRAGMLGKVAAKARRLFKGPVSGDVRLRMIARAAESALARFPLEVVEMEEAFGLAAAVIELKRVPVVIRLHGPWFINGEVLGEKKDAAFHKRVEEEGRAIAAADAVTAPSQDILDRTRAYYGLPLAEARVIPCPIDVRPDVAPWSPADSDPDRIVFIGRFDLHKGGDLMIDAFAELAASRPGLSLDFVGPDRGVPDPSGRLVKIGEYIERRIPDGKVARRIRVHGQKLPDQIDEFRRRGAVIIVPSRYETFGYTAVEALRLGCPVVAAGVGGLREIVRDGQTGLLFPAGDSQSLVGQIERLLSAPELAARLGEAGRRDVQSRYDAISIAENTLDLYASVGGHRVRETTVRRDFSRPNA